MAHSGGFSGPRLARLGAVLRRHVEGGAIAGAVALLSRGGEVHAEAVGTMDLASGAPMRRDTIFRIASMTKPIAAAAAMILAEEARLRLDDPVDRFLLELADRRVLRRLDGPLDDTVPAHRPITLRDLLTFRAGLGATMAPAGACPIEAAMAEAGLAPGPNPPDLAPDELMRRVGALPLMHQPGERWLYHTAYDILGVLVARAAGMRFENVLAERILGPLGMRDTAFVVPEAKRDRLAGCYEAGGRGGDGGALVPCREARSAAAPSGSTGLFSTADDYLAFGRMMLAFGRHGAERLLARPTVEAMTTDQITPEQKAASPFLPGFWESRGWGFGVSMVTRRDGIAASPGRFGWDGGFGTSWYADPREDLVGILMIQRPFDPVVLGIHADFWTLAYQAIAD
jgi:CubicO group peptidase (beta-lactamase class C family)